MNISALRNASVSFAGYNRTKFDRDLVNKHVQYLKEARKTPGRITEQLNGDLLVHPDPAGTVKTDLLYTRKGSVLRVQENSKSMWQVLPPSALNGHLGLPPKRK